MTHARRQSAFTLIELIIVLVVLSVIIGMCAPSLRGFGQSAKLNDATQQLLATTRWARSEAIATAVTHRIELDIANNAYSVVRQDGLTYVPVDGEFGHATSMPIGFTLQLASGGIDGRGIEFYPTSRSTPAVVRITTPAGMTSELASNFPADTFKVITATGGVR